MNLTIANPSPLITEIESKNEKDLKGKIAQCPCNNHPCKSKEMIYHGNAFMEAINYYVQSNIFLNQSFRHFEGNYYKHHIKKSRFLMTNAMKGLSGKAIILGPGLIEPLEVIAKQFKEVVLLDFDDILLKELASKYKNVSYKKVDFTGNLCGTLTKRIKEFAVHKSPFIARKDIDLDFSSPLSNESWIKDIGQADLVISSLVCSSLSYQVKFFFKNSAIASNTLADLPVSLSLFEKLDKRLHIQHLNDLQALVKPSGRIYFSDTFIEKPLKPIIGDVSLLTHQIIHPETLKHLRNHFIINHHHSWHWLIAPCSNTCQGFEVQAFIMSNAN